jgi:hypothetical protein
MATKTAFQEALETGAIPSLYQAADTLNIANRNPTFLQSVAQAPASIAKFIGVSLISGANEIYNIPASVGNIFGMDNKISKTEDVVAALDSDLSEFYKDHKGGADLVGFMVSSLVPGLGGVKILNAGQRSLKGAITANNYGTNMSQGLGLLVPARKKLLKAATVEVANGTAPATLTNANVLKSVASGFGQNVYEAAAFEIAVATTMSSSPILENQDFGDFAWNIAIGGGVFGVFGAAINTAKANSALKKAAVEWDNAASPYKFIEEAASKSASHESISLDLEQLKNIPELPATGSPELLANLGATRKTVIQTLAGRVRKQVGELANGDQDIANVYHGLLANTSIENQQYNYAMLLDISRMGQPTKEIIQIEKMSKRLRDDKLDPFNNADDAAFLADEKHIAYVRMYGDDAGQVYETSPLKALADTIGKDSKIQITKHSVRVGDEVPIKFSQGNITGKYANAETASTGDIMNMSPRKVEARYAWSRSSELDNFAKGPVTIHGNDIPMLEKLLREVPDAATNPNVKFILPENVIGDPKQMGLQEFVFGQKKLLANAMDAKNIAAGKVILTQEQIAKNVNIRSRFLSGEQRTTPGGGEHPDDMLAIDAYTKETADKLGVEVVDGKIQIGTSQEGGKSLHEIPQTVRAIYDGNPRKAGLNEVEVNNFVTENMVNIRLEQKAYVAGNNNASSGYLGAEIWNALPEITTPRVRTGAVSTGAGPGGLSAASSNYGSLAALVEYVGSVTSRAIGDFKTSARDTLEPHLYALGQNQEAAIEWATLNANVRNIKGEYGLNEAGDALIPLVVKRYNELAANAMANKTAMPENFILPDANMPLEIPLLSQEVRNMARAHVQVNGKRTEGLVAIRAAQGVDMNRSMDAFYPVPVNPKEHKFFGMVIDRSVTGGNTNRTLFATSAEELKVMKAKIEQGNPHLEVLTKSKAEKYYADFGLWDYEKTLNNTYLNTEAQRAGTSAPFIVSTNPKKIVDDALSWHLQRETGMVREAISAKYEVQFEELRRLGDEATDIETSKFSDQSLLTFAEESVNNPFGSYVKTALAVKDNTSYPIWNNINTSADRAVSRVQKAVHDAFYSTKGDADVDQINGMLKRAGYKGVQYDPEMIVFANAQPAVGALNTFVQKANSILATVVLRWDSLNAINNAVSANVLLGAEMKAIQRAIDRGDSGAIGELAKLTKIAIPGAEGVSMQAPTKLIANAIKRLHEEGMNGPTMQFYKDNGYLTSITDQYRDAIDTLTFTGRESVDQLDSLANGLKKRMRAAGDAGEKWTGNKLAEEFNRFVAADVMKQISDVGVSRGLISQAEQLSYINTFVNRTQGNYLASQRPMAFQGPIGQAVGLFQTYQFNLLQQMFRHVGEGHSKDALTLLGLQGTIHGMNGLPAFNAVNTHIVGSASGNTQHRDAYDATYGIAGKEAGDFLMYGMASTALGLLSPDLKVNLYTRGDLNPRQVTILPVNPAKVPIVQAFGKFAKNIINTAQQLPVIGAGGDVATTLLKGLEHNGISRPLAGLGAALEAFNNPQRASFSTSNRGNVVAANDLLSLANLARIAGGKPLDEAIALDATYRFQAYGLKDARKRQLLGAAIKSTVLAGNNPTSEQINKFATNYAAIGGKQEEFAGWFTQLYKEANSSQANEILRNLNSPYNQAMQEIMGGEPVRDFSGQ